MELFSTAGYVAGIHGAGLANIIFRKNAPLRVLEIFDPAYFNYFGYLPGTYFLISRMYDFDYRAMVGQSSEKSTRDSRSFLVDPAKLAKELENMLA
jgi:capsular polysaccharide biosynthesis protein